MTTLPSRLPPANYAFRPLPVPAKTATISYNFSYPAPHDIGFAPAPGPVPVAPVGARPAGLPLGLSVADNQRLLAHAALPVPGRAPGVPWQRTLLKRGAAACLGALVGAGLMTAAALTTIPHVFFWVGLAVATLTTMALLVWGVYALARQPRLTNNPMAQIQPLAQLGPEAEMRRMGPERFTGSYDYAQEIFHHSSGRVQFSAALKKQKENVFRFAGYTFKFETCALTRVDLDVRFDPHSRQLTGSVRFAPAIAMRDAATSIGMQFGPFQQFANSAPVTVTGLDIKPGGEISLTEGSEILNATVAEWLQFFVPARNKSFSYFKDFYQFVDSAVFHQSPAPTDPAGIEAAAAGVREMVQSMDDLITLFDLDGLDPLRESAARNGLVRLFNLDGQDPHRAAAARCFVNFSTDLPDDITLDLPAATHSVPAGRYDTHLISTLYGAAGDKCLHALVGEVFEVPAPVPAISLLPSYLVGATATVDVKSGDHFEIRTQARALA